MEMSTDSERQDSCDDEPTDSCGPQCYVSLKKLTREEIERWTNPQLVCQVNDAFLVNNDHNYSNASSTQDSATSTEEADGNRVANCTKKSMEDGYTSLYDDDQIISIELDQNSKKKIQTYEKCSIPENLLKKFNSMRRKQNASTLPLFCLFCLKEYNNINQALSCHYQQTKHFPFRCVECEEVTLDVKDMIQHYANSHSTCNRVQYRRSFAPAKERWARKFLIYQLQCITNQAAMVPNGILHKYCPVCNQYDYKLGQKFPRSKPHHKLFTVLDKNHIHKHLKYHPFQCLLCLKQNIRFDFTTVNKKARLHLINRHGLSEPTEKDLKDNFDSLGMIPELERYICTYVTYVQDSFSSRHALNISPISNSSNSTPKKLLSTPTSSSASATQSTPLSTLSSAKKSSAAGKANKSTTGKKRRQTNDYSIDDMYYPSPKYARRDYSKNKNGRRISCNSQNIDSSVIDLDSFYEDSANLDLKPEQAQRIICIFCNDQITDILAAWDHYAIHLNYRPITCQLCQKSFPGPKAFQFHGSNHVEYDNLPYTWNHDEIIETWSRDFLHSITDDFIASPEFACCCPICCKKYEKQKIASQKLCYEDVRKHIYSHLRYRPYHCNLCCDDKFYVSDLENDGVRHLTFHEIICSKNELSNYFTKSRGIEAVDVFLVEHFKRIRKFFNIADGNMNGDVPMPNDPLCDVALLFNSLQETLGHSTLDNILDNVSHSEAMPSSFQGSSAIEYPCTPLSTTSDPIATSSPPEPYPISVESSDTMVPCASESSAKNSPSQNTNDVVEFDGAIDKKKSIEKEIVNVECSLNNEADTKKETAGQVVSVSSDKVTENQKTNVDIKIEKVFEDTQMVNEMNGPEQANHNGVAENSNDTGINKEENTILVDKKTCELVKTVSLNEVKERVDTIKTVISDEKATKLEKINKIHAIIKLNDQDKVFKSTNDIKKEKFLSDLSTVKKEIIVEDIEIDDKKAVVEKQSTKTTPTATSKISTSRPNNSRPKTSLTGTPSTRTRSKTVKPLKVTASTQT